jgi:fimbrial chaperone protein
MYTQRILAGFIMFFGLVANQVNAQLLIYPVRVAFDNTERSAQVNLTNTSDKTRTYRLEWRENRALPERGYATLSEEEAKSFPIASSMIRFSPRQVTLKPGERQLIKLNLRRPRGLAEGEYRSHLLFKAIAGNDKDTGAAATGTKINIQLSFSIPVTIQQGVYDTQVMFKKANIVYKPSDGSRSVSLDLARKGLHSASGDISAYWTPNGGKEILLAKIADYNLWPELNEAQALMISTSEEFTPADGQLRILYEGVRDFKGNTYLDVVIRVKRSQILIEEK